MTSAQVVIGAGFGDEGKGLAVDFYASQASGPVTVVRFNGGAQAGHTVQQGDTGRRHVFSHFGSGSLAGAATFLSRHFVVHPEIFSREFVELRPFFRDWYAPPVMVDPDALVTTPYDIILNRAIEQHRGTTRHGSVGIGFGETINRAENGFALRVRDLWDQRTIVDYLARISALYVPRRLKALGLDGRFFVYPTPAITDEWLVHVELFRQRTIPMPAGQALANTSIIFEGAQGLLLDKDYGHRFPYVTRSSTGLTNVLDISKEVGIDKLDVLYITRPYATRHGAGPLPHEVVWLPFAMVADETNREGPWQGSLRLGYLDVGMRREAIKRDLDAAHEAGIEVIAGAAVTCVDQLTGSVVLHDGNSRSSVSPERSPEEIARQLGLTLRWAGFGPVRGRIRRMSWDR